MTYNDPFTLEKKEYVRQLDPFNQYVEQASFYLSKTQNIAIDDAKKWITDNLKENGKFAFNNPLIKMTQKNQYGDTEIVTSTLAKFIQDSIADNDIIPPTMNTYVAEKVKKSYLVDFTLNNLKKRSIEKKAMFRYKLAGDTTNFLIKKNAQNNAKVFNNSISGASQVASTPIYNSNMHPALTSTCRTTSAYANANNEKLLAGNRHYFSPEVTINNIISLSKYINRDELAKVIKKYSIKIPSVQETYDCILESSRQYFRDRFREQEWYDVISNLDDLERASVVYTGDLYHLRIHNEKLVYKLLSELSNKYPVKEDLTLEEYLQIQNEAPEPIFQLACQICKKESIGKDAAKEDVRKSELGKLLASNILELYKVVDKYSDFFSCFFRTIHVPAAVADFKDSIRKCVLMSDTDSTIFTVEEWVNWYFGEITFKDEANALFAALVFVSVASLKHLLAMMSANMGVDNERIHLIAMKNEFKFEVFVPTLNTKHYYALITFCEGNTYATPELEVKGVHLKNSNSPPYINKKAQEMMLDICNRYYNGKDIPVENYMKQIADIEKDILDRIDDGSTEFYRVMTIKGADAYSQDETESNYKNHTFWNSTFGKVYGMMPEPPYQVIKVSTGFNNKTDMKNFIDSLENKQLAKDIKEWVDNTSSGVIKTFYVPKQLFSDKPIPKIIIDSIDKRKMVLDICHTLYYILETLGVFRANKNATRLFNDEIYKRLESDVYYG